jgi:hypothetical protein
LPQVWRINWKRDVEYSSNGHDTLIKCYGMDAHILLEARKGLLIFWFSCCQLVLFNQKWIIYNLMVTLNMANQSEILTPFFITEFNINI